MAVGAICGTGAGSGAFLTFSSLGITDVRVTEIEQPFKDNPIDIPYMPGAKDGSDGTLGLGSITLSGIVHASTAGNIEGIEATISAALAGKTDFYVWTVYPGGGHGQYHNVLKCQSVRVSDVEGWIGERWSVTVTFARIPA